MESSDAAGGEDIFSWMFMNPDLFPARNVISASPDDMFLEEDDFPFDTAMPAETVAIADAAQPLPSSPIKQEPAPPQNSDDDDDEEEEEEEEGSPTTNTSLLSSTTTATATTGNKNEDKASREKRLEKNREIARNCRKRKREKQQSLEEEVAKLREWNSQLEAKLMQIHPETLSKELVRKREIEEIYHLVELANTTEQEVQEKLDLHKEVYAGFGKERKQAISYHLEQLKILLLPNQVSKMTLYALQQEDEFYNEERNKTTFGGGIWNLLCEELELTGEQKNTLLNMRKEIRSQRQSVSKCLSTLRQLEVKIKENLSSSVVQMAKVQKLTTPSQQAKFLWWIENNQNQIEVLNNMWEQKRKQ